MATLLPDQPAVAKEDPTIRRLREYFELCSYVDAQTNQFLDPQDPRASCTTPLKPLSVWGIVSINDYRRCVQKEMTWLLNNTRSVLEALPALENEWYGCCEGVRQILALEQQKRASTRLPFRKRQ